MIVIVTVECLVHPGEFIKKVIRFVSKEKYLDVFSRLSMVNFGVGSVGEFQERTFFWEYSNEITSFMIL